MKKIAGFLILLFTFNSCDDGNLTQENIDFEAFTTQSCTNNDIIYKINDKEALLIEIPSTNFVNDPTSDNSPRTLTISPTSNRVVYRFYNGTIGSDNICETIQPATPIVVDQWSATSGTIEITTTAIKSTNTTDNSTKITGYNHFINLKDVTFSIKNGQQTFRTLPFGDYTTTTTSLPFNFEKILTKCSNSNVIYDFKSFEAILLDIDPTLIVNEATPANTPRTGLIGTTTNKLTYRYFSGLLSSAYFCNATTPTTPALSEEWNGVAGVTNTSGIIEVTTTTNGPNSFKHTITLRKVSLKKGNSSFTLGDNYILGELFTTN
ncbi:hypothetical protein [Flavobacterium sp. UMI-01]|uniref:hypothetical protein n=1 Tax=Flavobacterium sp. UMI-01 TaxID=1441053 RepID=UPI001C7DCDEF|nr:hypothetical protein [Flavobacterium sp. UMI-01]GIZ10460.1 hypothetical protein FUMI01_31840 [Flavobacterium sp. UMI-01]